MHYVGPTLDQQRMPANLVLDKSLLKRLPNVGPMYTGGLFLKI